MKDYVSAEERLYFPSLIKENILNGIYFLILVGFFYYLLYVVSEV